MPNTPESLRTSPENISSAMDRVAKENGAQFHVTTRDTVFSSAGELPSIPVSTVHVLAGIGKYDNEMYQITRRADLPAGYLSRFRETHLVYITNTQFPVPSGGLTNALEQAAKSAKKEGTGQVLPIHLLEAVAQNPEVEQALASDEAAIERLRSEINLYKNKQVLASKLEILTMGYIRREKREHLLKDIQNVFEKHRKDRDDRQLD